jgi:hypothetical protein
LSYVGRYIVFSFQSFSKLKGLRNAYRHRWPMADP